MIEWMPDENEIDGFVDGCEQYDRNYVLDRWGKLAQRKLLQYLIENRFSDISQQSTDQRVYLKSMLKKLDEKQNVH